MAMIYTPGDTAVSVRRNDDGGWTIELEVDDELHLTTDQIRSIVVGYIFESMTSAEPMTRAEIDREVNKELGLLVAN